MAERSEPLIAVLKDVRELFTPVVVLGEFQFGIAGSRHAARYEDWLARMVNACNVLDLDRTTARHYAIIRSELKAMGRPIPSNDTWIAALGRQHRLPVVSRDQHFDHVVGIERLRW